MFFFGKRDKQGALRKHAQRVANKRAQAPDRWESIQALASMEQPESVTALLKRFTYITDPSITDQEEKDAVFKAIVDMGELAIGPVLEALKRSDSISWPLKLLATLQSESMVTGHLLELLATMDIEYERDPEKKQQILAELSMRSDPRVAGVAERFLEDVNETCRFHAVAALLAQPTDAEPVRTVLAKLLVREESMRVRARILEGFADAGWSVEASDRAALAKGLPEGYRFGPKGQVLKT